MTNIFEFGLSFFDDNFREGRSIFTEEKYEVVKKVPENDLVQLLLFDMGINFAAIREGSNYSMQVFNLMNYFDQTNRLEVFYDHLVARRPDLTLEFSDVFSNILKSTSGEGTLEAAIINRPDPISIDKIYEKVSEFERRVCSISVPVGAVVKLGTGWLVGPDLVITNRHVVRDIIEGEADRSNVEFKFDYRTNSDGLVVNSGTVIGLYQEDDWCIAESPHAIEDLNLGTPDPSTDMLDYAIVRIDNAIGDRSVRKKSENKRGWFALFDNPLPTKDQDVIIIQHPNGEPLAESRGRVKEILGNRSRLRYDAVTYGGSSGSPVTDYKFNIVALHHAGDPIHPDFTRYNQAIPIGLIRADLVSKNVNLESFNE